MENTGYGNDQALDITSKNPSSATLTVKNMNPKLYKAVTSGKIELLESLLEQNIDLQQVTPMRDTSIHIAAGRGHLEIVKTIHRRCPTLFTKQNLVGDTSLHRAARAGHSTVVSFLIDCTKSSVDSSSRDVEIGRAEAIDLLRKGNDEKETLMHEAVRNRNHEVVKLLIREDPELLCIVNYADESPLHVAVEKGALNIVEEILKTDHYSCKGPNGRTALHAAIIHENRDITKVLLEKNPELVKVADDNRRTPLHFASALGHLYSVQMLLERDTSMICFLDKTGSAPVHMSVYFGQLDIVKEFIQVHPDLKDLLDGRCRNMLHIAIEGQQVGVFKYILKQKGFEGIINGKDKDGNRPLHQAADTGNPYIVSVLARDKRVDLTATNREGSTALAIARSRITDELNKEHTKAHIVVLRTLWRAAHPPWYFRGIMENDINKNDIKSIEHDTIEAYKEKANTLLVVATLVATVTFAVGFTLPGGYEDSNDPNPGMARLQNRRDFEDFLSIDAAGVYFSVIAVIALIWVQIMKDIRIVRAIFVASQVFTSLALYIMTMAFRVGVNWTLLHSHKISGGFWALDGVLLFISFAAVFIKARRLILEKIWLRFWARFYLKGEKDVSILFRYNVEVMIK